MKMLPECSLLKASLNVSRPYITRKSLKKENKL